MIKKRQQKIFFFPVFSNSRRITRLVIFAFGKQPINPLNNH